VYLPRSAILSSVRGLVAVKVFGGLCNRLRALLSAAAFADVTERRFAYEWRVGGELGADVRDLWHLPYRALPRGATTAISKLAGGYAKMNELTLESRQRVLCVYTGEVILRRHPAIPYWTEMLRTLEPVRQIVERVEAEKRSWPDRPMVGVMIRAHRPHVRTAELSPPEWFFGRMAEIRAERPDVVFFLSTDTPQVAIEMHDRFDDVHELSAKSDFNSAQGVEDAVCDLYLLASCGYVLGSHNSSFSQAACELAPAYETATRPPGRPIADLF
jgi:hypothetical protein